MKKIGALILGIMAIAALFPVNYFMVSAAGDAGFAVYLGETVPKGGAESGIWQSYDAVGQGYSSVRFGVESEGAEENNFVRLANFDGAETGDCTQVSVRLAGDTSSKISFSYRLYEGDMEYGENDPVFLLSWRGAERVILFRELIYNADSEFGWQTFSDVLETNGNMADRLTITFFYSSAAPYRSSFCYADLDDIMIGNDIGNKEDFEEIGVTKSELAYTASAELIPILSSEEAVCYEENTQMEDAVRINFNDGSLCSVLPTSYRGATSVSSGESDILAVYDSHADNTYLRLANFNGSTTKTRFTNYFYNNEEGMSGNLPTTSEYVYFSFRYRLYINDEILAGLVNDEDVITFETRGSSLNHSGGISVDELVINAPGDFTWHTYSGVLNIRKNTVTEYLFIHFESYADSSYSDSTYLDLDGLFLSNFRSGVNYAQLNGEFEGLATDKNFAGVFYREAMGEQAQKVEYDSGYAMALQAGQTFSVRTQTDRIKGAYYAAFDAAADAGTSMSVYFSGRNGTQISVRVGEDADEATYSVSWEQLEGMWRCRIYIARSTYRGMSSVDFVNEDEKTVLIDNVTAASVRSVCAVPGDYANYTTRLSALLESYEADKDDYKTSALPALNRAVLHAKRVGEYGSQERMDSALSALEAALAGERRADLTRLNETIGQAMDIMEKGESAYEKSGWTAFFNSLAEAKKITGEDAQADVDKAADALAECMNLLVAVEPTEEGADTELAIICGTVGGGTVLGAGALVLLKRRPL